MGALTRLGESLGILRRYSAQNLGGTPLPTITPGRTSSLVDETALSLDAIYRAVTILETAAAQLTLDVWHGDTLTDPPTWITRPDPWSTPTTWLKETVGSLALRGNAYWKITRASNGQPAQLAVLDPLDVTITATRTGIPIYHVEGDTLTGRDIIQLQLLRRPGRRNLYGLGPIQAASAGILGAVTMRDYASGWMTTGTIPNGILTTEQELSADQASAIKDRWLSSVKTSEPMVLGKGTTYAPLSLKPQELQWLEAQQFNVTSIARLFGIPGRLMLAALDGSSSTYANLQQEDLSFLRWTLMQYLSEIEQAITWLLPRGNSARFNVDGLLRADTLTRYQAHQIGLNAGFLDVDEVRAIEGLPPRSTHA
ncbi:phage portal protein [Acidipropionibacterium timonense]|uniref:phage portal protein n=1 Tax=Acidipropionibacterium timonense TaxID=2161818 RepID=UPI001030526B|nr:phage portal protein [Acidipropionibacterium timonense]